MFPGSIRAVRRGRGTAQDLPSGLLATVCLTAVLWNYRHVIILMIGAVYFLGRGWFWFGRNYPMAIWFILGFVRGLSR